MLGHHVHRENRETTALAIEEEMKEFGMEVGQIFLAVNRSGIIMKNLGDLSNSTIPVFVHSAYTNSLWSKSEKQRESIKTQFDMIAKNKLKGLVFHHGKKTAQQIFEGVEAQPKTKCKILLEQSVAKPHPNQTHETPDKLNLLAETMAKSKRDWGMVLDTAHLWAMGTDLSTEDKMNQFLSGLKCVEHIDLIHFNGSMNTLNGNKDKHAIPAGADDKMWDHEKNLGWVALMKWCQTNNKPMTMEVNRGSVSDMKKVYDKWNSLKKK